MSTAAPGMGPSLLCKGPETCAAGSFDNLWWAYTRPEGSQIQDPYYKLRPATLAAQLQP